MNAKKHINGVALIRVSTAAQAGESRAGIPAQREAIRKIQETHGIHIAPEHRFELTDISGSRVLDSTDYQRFLRVVERPDITAVVTKEFSRLMRPERFDDYRIIQHFIDHGITLYFPDAVMNLSNRQDWLIAAIRAAMSGMEKFDIRQRMMDGKETMRRQGRHPSAPHTLARGIGYNKKVGWYYKEDELGVVRLLFKLFLQGEHNYHRLAAATGIPRSSVRILLENPVYAGVMTYATRHDLSPIGLYPPRNGKRSYRRKIARMEDEVIRVPLPLEPVITIEQHNYILNVVENLRAPRAEARDSAISRFTYRGHLRCGSCDDLIYSWVGGHRKNGDSKDFYYCKSRSPREREKRRATAAAVECENRYMTRSKLETEIDVALTAQLTNPQFLISAIESHIARAEQDDGSDQIRTFNEQLRRLAVKKERIIQSFIDGDMDRMQKQLRVGEIEREIHSLTHILSRVRPATTFDRKQITDMVGVFREWTFLAMGEKRQLMERLLPEIYVDRYAVKGVTLRVGCNGDNHPRGVDVKPPERCVEIQEAHRETKHRCAPC
jgi:DNA invertase Pin-like site-specific DNA recombinase